MTPDSGGAAGVLTAAGDVVLNPNNLNLTGVNQVIPNVKIQLIFLTDPNGGSPLSVPAATQTAIKNFFTTITSDQYIPNLLSQYGGIQGLPAIGTGSVGVVDTSASVNADTTLLGHRAYSSGNLTSIIQAEINNGDSAASDGLNNLYFIFTPPTDAVIQGSINSIQNFGGYHLSFLDSGSGKRDYYAVIPDESSVNINFFGSGNTNALRGETMAASHEMSEAITDDVVPRGWVNPTLLGSGEIGDLAVEEVYVDDGHEIQYLWSNAIGGAAHAPSSGASDLFINQLTPPAVPVSTSTSIPVATFTTVNTSLTAGSFSAEVFNYDTTGHGHVNWTVTSITGSNGHFVVNAEPDSAVTAGTYGTTYAQAEGLYVDILDNNSADATTVDGGIPIAQTYAPYVVAASSPLTYTTDAGTHNLVLKENGPNFELRDNGNLVFTQPVALTTNIVISGDGDPAGVDNSLTLDYSGAVFNTVPVTFDGGNGSGNHKVTVTGAALTSLTYDATAASVGDFVVNGNSTDSIAFTHAQMTTDSATTSAVTLNIDPNNTISGLVNTMFTGSGANSTATLDNSLASFTFGNPTTNMVVIGHSTNDDITFTSLGSGFNASLTVTGNGGTDTVNLNTSLSLGSGTSSGNVSITASTINLNTATIATNNGGTNGIVTVDGAVSLQQNLSVLAGSGAVEFNGSVNGGFALQVNSSGLTTLAAIIGATPLASLSVSGPVSLGGASISVFGTVGFGGDATLTTNVAISYGGINGLQINGSILDVANNQLTLTDAANTDAGSISSQVTGMGSLLKDGPGELTLSNASNSFSGTTTVNAGTLLVDGVTASGNGVTVAGGAALGGAGTINGPVIDNGTIAPGDSPGILNTGSVSFASNASFAVQIGGTTAGDGSNHYDQLNVTGTVMIGSNVTLNLSALGGFVPAVGQSFTIISNTGAGVLSGTFIGLAEGATISNFLGSGLTAVITYAGGSSHNSVILSMQVSTQTSLRSSSNPSTFGQSVTFTATVSSSGGTPTGTVAFMDGSIPLGNGTLSSGVATFSTSNLSVASHSITAVYDDSGSFLGSTSPPLTQVVSGVSTITSLTSSANESTYGMSVTFTATVSSSGGTPTGSVEFFDDSTSADLGSGTFESTSGDTAIWDYVTNPTQLTVTTSPGAQAIRAVYSPTGAFVGSSGTLSGGETITPVALTVSGITANNKIYDSTVVASLNTSSATLHGVFTGDSVSLSTTGATGAFASKSVGSGINVSVSGLTISGTQAVDYTLTQPNASANITPFGLTVSGITASDKVYDSTTDATLNTGTDSLIGVFNGDSVTLDSNGASGMFTSSDAGIGINVAVNGLSLGGPQAEDYTLSQPTVTANITPATLQVTGITAVNILYDHTTTASLNLGTAALAGVFREDSVSLSTAGAAGTFASKDVGIAIPVNVSGLTIRGAQASDYILTQPSTMASIAPIGLTVAGITADDKVYDHTTTADLNTGSAALVGVFTEDTVTLSTTGATGAFASKDVGTGISVIVSGLTLGGTQSADYTVTQPTTLANITPAILTVTGITASNKVYDGTTTATLDTTGASLVGVFLGDTVTLGTSGATGMYASAKVGTGITVSVVGLTIGGSQAGDYTLTQPTTTGNISSGVAPDPVLVSGQPNGTVLVYTLGVGSQYSRSSTAALQPFGAITADIRTAVGDVNGDGIPDDIFATGPGTELEVTVLSGAAGNPVLVAPFDPFLPAPPLAQSDVFTAGGFVSAGDFLNNGRDQIVISPDQSGGPRVAIYDLDGAAAATTQPYTAVGVNTAEVNPGSGLTRINNFLSVNADFRGGARTAVGDLNGDEVPDLAIAAGFGGGPAVLVINGTKVATTNGFTASDDLIGDFFAFNSSLRDGAYLAIGDVLGNGQQDLILGPGAGGPSEVEVISGTQIINQGAIAALANPVANFVPTGLGPDGSGMRVAVAATGVGDQVNVVLGTGRNMSGLVKVYPGSGFTSGSTSEPTGGQILNPDNGTALTDGVFVG